MRYEIRPLVAMAKRMHPDLGGLRADWDRLDEARRVLAEAGMMR